MNCYFCLPEMGGIDIHHPTFVYYAQVKNFVLR